MENNKILEIKQIEKITGTVDCKEAGTCFLVQSNLALTARHVIEKDIENDQIEIVFPNIENGKTTAKVVDEDIDCDIAILELEKSFDLETFPLSVTRVQREEDWEAYGFPNTKRIAGHIAKGKISRENDDFQDWDIDIRTESDDIDSHQAMSGSALVSKGKIVGILIKEQDVNKTIYCVSTYKLKSFLQKHNIPLDEPNSEIPEDLIEDIEGVEENYIAINKINEIVKRHNNGYIGVIGSPGSGKTTVAAQFYSDDSSFKILGKYFIKSRKRSQRIYGNQDEFTKWCDVIIHNELFNTLPAKQELKDIIISFDEKLNALSDKLLKSNKTGIIVIDGIDYIHNSNEFFSVLENIPKNIIILVFGTSTSFFPNYINLNDSRIFNLQPLNSHQCEIFIQNELKDLINGVQQKELAIKSEGHPLYLHYLVNYIKENSSNVNIENWLTEIPVIGGKIEAYYSQLWRKIENSPSIIYLVSTLSQLRQSVSETILQKFLLLDFKHSFIADFKNIKHLVSLKNSVIYIFHSSFVDFIKQKTEQVNGKDIHSAIANYCDSYPDDNFSILNHIYHQIKSNNPEKTVELCNQNWVDKCTKIHINPIYLIDDIKLVLEYAIDNGKVAEVIRIKLLQQRVDFRYNHLFDDCAFELADMLISKNEPENAIKYLIRNNQLIASISDSIYFLNRLYHINANYEAEQLLEIIRKHCFSEYERVVSNTEKETKLGSDIPLAHLNSITLSINTDEERSNNEFPHVSKVLMKMFNAASDENGNEFKNNLLNVALCYRYAYYLFHLDYYISIEKWKEIVPEFDNSWSEVWALTLHQYLKFERHHRGLKRTEQLEKVVSDFEYFIEEYSHRNNYLEFIVDILIKLSNKIDLTIKIINELKPVELNLREENRVDVNSNNIYRKQIDFYATGYVNSSISKLVNRSNNWEEWTKSFIQVISEIKGYAYRLKHQNNEEELKELYKRFQSVLTNLNFTLDERSRWYRSNLIPEGVFPIVWREIASIYLEFYPDKIADLISIIASKKEDQFGLYSEGFRECLFNIVDELLIFGSCKNYKTEVYTVLQILEEHVVKGIENRLERTPLLLRVIDAYARIEHKAKTNSVFDEMLKTTQGPGWYKDGQFNLINKSLRKFANSNEEHLQSYASLFDFALGEMTFQRYAKSEREDFIGSVVRNWGLATAINLFKYWTLPEPEIIKQNAERKTIDMPRPGDGFDLGAHYVNEQSCIIAILKSCENIKPITLWAFSEVFIVGDFRYNNSFAEFQATVLNHFEKENIEVYGLVYNRLLEIIKNNLPQLRDFYFPNLAENVSNETFEKLKISLNELNIDLPNKKEIEPEKHLSFKDLPDNISELDKLDYYVSAAKDELKIEDNDAAIQLLLDGFEHLNKSKISFWFRNYSNSTDNAFKLFSNIYQTSENMMIYIKNHILNPNFNEWEVVSGLLSLLENKLENQNVRNEIHNHIKEHFELIVKPPSDIHKKYEWLNPIENTNTETQLIDLLIWFLNHPHFSIKQRIEEILIWASTIEPELYIPRIINETLLQKPQISSEICSLIILKLSKSSPEILAKALENTDLNVEVNHFVIKYNLLQAFALIKQYSERISELNEKYSNSFSNIIQVRGSCEFEEDYLLPVQEIINELEKESLLDGKVCRFVEENINKLCKPVEKIEVVKTDNYIARSFFEEQFDVKQFGNYVYYLKYLINCSISKNVAKSQFEFVYELLKSY